jgi:hypothetical protein
MRKNNGHVHMKYLLFNSLLILSIYGQSSAPKAPVKISQETIDYIRQGTVATDREVIQVETELKKQKLLLSKNIKELLPLMYDDKARDLFKIEQRYWRQYAMAKYDVARDSYRGGYLSTLMGLQALLTLHKVRVADIQEYIKNHQSH